MPGQRKLIRASLIDEDCSGSEQQSGIESALLDGSPLSEPGGIHPVLVTLGSAFVIDVFGHRAEQPSGGAFGSVQGRTATIAVI